jgi:hypothetical protein
MYCFVARSVRDTLTHATMIEFTRGTTIRQLRIFTAIRRASSLLSNLAAEPPARLILEIDIGERAWPLL